MTNNDILRKIRYIYDCSDTKMIELFASGGMTVTRAQVSDWLKKDDAEDYKALRDLEFASFLNGFINEKRGQKEGVQMQAESSLNNNIIFRKLKIALNLTDDDLMELFEKAQFKVSKTELSALFRKPDHKHYRPCKDQFLRNFLLGLQLANKGGE
ncbi:MAG: DUF1456 family protein [Bacteroidota bacterium]